MASKRSAVSWALSDFIEMLSPTKTVLCSHQGRLGDAGTGRGGSGPPAAIDRRRAVALLTGTLTLSLDRRQTARAESGSEAGPSPPAAPPQLRTKFITKCKPGFKCVSTASFNEPSQYASPWIIPYNTTLMEGCEQLKRALEEVASDGEIAVSWPPDVVPGGVTALAMTASAKGWGDDTRFLLKEDPDKGGVGIVTFTIRGAESGTKGFGLSLPNQPFCVENGCITGPPQRKYVEAIRNKLGWLPLETDEDKKWVQIMSPFLINPDDYVSAFE